LLPAASGLAYMAPATVRRVQRVHEAPRDARSHDPSISTTEEGSMTTTVEVSTFPRQVAGTWTLTSSMVHGGNEVLGTTKLFRGKGYVVNGRKVRIPIVSGSAL